MRNQRGSRRGLDDDDARVTRGLEIAPVPLNLRGKSRELVGLGSYLVNAVAGCNDCHWQDPNQLCARRDLLQGQSTHRRQSVHLPGRWAKFRVAYPGHSGDRVPKSDSRPDWRPAGGLSFAQFRHILRSGRGSRSSTSELFVDRNHELLSGAATLQRRFAAGHALAPVSESCATAIYVRSTSTYVQSRAFKDPLVACCTTIAPDSSGSANNRSAFEATRRIRQFGPWRY